MPQPNLESGECYSYADYYAWDDGKRWELIDGKIYPLSGSPGRLHQSVLGSLTVQFANYLDRKCIALYHAPLDVCFIDKPGAADHEIATVVQPDMFVVLDKCKLEDRCCMGTPDLLVEILTAESAAHDLKTKYDIYQRFGVKEYWIIYPAEHVLQIYKLGDDGCYGAAERYAGDDKVAVAMLGDLIVDLKEVFAE